MNIDNNIKTCVTGLNCQAGYATVSHCISESFRKWPLLKSDTAIQRYSDTRSRSRSPNQSHANFSGGVNFTPYKVKYIPVS